MKNLSPLFLTLILIPNFLYCTNGQVIFRYKPEGYNPVQIISVDSSDNAAIVNQVAVLKAQMTKWESVGVQCRNVTEFVPHADFTLEKVLGIIARINKSFATPKNE